MKQLFSKNSFLITAILYPLSWVYYSGPNMSFIAWIAFVPLFHYLQQNEQNIVRFLGASFFVIACWTSVTASWLFQFTQATWLISATVFSETLHIWLPFVVLYFIQKGIGFKRGLFLFPFIWAAWEWIFLSLPHTMGTHLLSYSQGNYLWLIQMADLGGMYLVSFWVMLFNVLIYTAYQQSDFQLSSKRFRNSSLKICAVMILIPLLYSAFAFHKYSKPTDDSIQVSIIPTQFTALELQNPALDKSIIERTLHRNDSLAYTQLEGGNTSDLYVWPEAGTSNWMNFPNITAILKQATTDWNATLITGCKGISPLDNKDDYYVSGVMISTRTDSVDRPLQYHHKTNLIAGTEYIPYEKALRPLIYGKSEDETRRYFTKGTVQQPLELITKSGAHHQVGVSLCYEQWFPETWAVQATNGAEFFVHMAAENWYGEVGYQQFMLNVNRFRAIETRRFVARSSNRGISTFINAVGQTYSELPLESLKTATAKINMRSNKTLFSRCPWFFPMTCLLVVLVLPFLPYRN